MQMVAEVVSVFLRFTYVKAGNAWFIIVTSDL